MRRYAPEGPIGPAEYAQPYAWWGWHWNPPVPMSIVQIVEAGTLSRRLAALLWILLEARRSIVLASEPPMSGKTTTLSALIPFLPADTRHVFLRGLAETFDYTRQGTAEKTYLLVNELSSHLPVYLWGRKATQMFRTLRDGYGLATTMHADDAAGVLSQLREELGVATEDLARLDLIGIMRLFRGRTPIVGHDDVPPEMRYGPGAIRRRLVSMHLVVANGDRIDTPVLSSWDPESDEHAMAIEPLLPELSDRAGRTTQSLCDALLARETFLADLSSRGVTRPREVARAIASYRGDTEEEVRA
jgi:hypothetical protein